MGCMCLGIFEVSMFFIASAISFAIHFILRIFEK